MLKYMAKMQDTNFEINHSVRQHRAVPLDLASPSVLCESVMLGRAGFAVDGNDGIG